MLRFWGPTSRFVTPLNRSEEGLFYTYANSSRSGNKEARLAQLHLDKNGDLISYTNCTFVSGNNKPECLQVSESSCWALSNFKELTAKPAKLINWKKQACSINSQVGKWFEASLEDPLKWVEQVLKADGVPTGIGSNQNLFNEELRKGFPKISPSPAPANVNNGFTQLAEQVEKLDCSIEDVLVGEQSVLVNYLKIAQPIAEQCQRISGLFPGFIKAQAVQSENKGAKGRKATPTRKNPPKKKDRAHWIWEN